MQEHVNKKESNKALWITAGVFAFLVIGLITNGFGLFSSSETDIDSQKISVGDSPVIGNEDAKLVIYEFSDFSCPYCQIASQNIIPQIERDYVDTGKARLVFKYFPGHGTGRMAQAVGYALDEQGLFWEFEPLAFQHQADADNLAAMKDIAENLGADMTKVDEFLNSGKAIVYMNNDIKMGRDVGITGTPTFIIGDKMIVGVQDYSEFKKVIDSEL